MTSRSTNAVNPDVARAAAKALKAFSGYRGPWLQPSPPAKVNPELAKAAAKALKALTRPRVHPTPGQLEMFSGVAGNRPSRFAHWEDW